MTIKEKINFLMQAGVKYPKSYLESVSEQRLNRMIHLVDKQLTNQELEQSFA